MERLQRSCLVFVLIFSLLTACGKERSGGGSDEFEFSSDPSNPDYYNKYGESGGGGSYVPNSIGESGGSGGEFSDEPSFDPSTAASPTDVGQTSNFLQNLIGQLRQGDPGDGGAMLSMLLGLLQQLRQKKATNEVLGKALFAALIAKHCAKGVKKGQQPPPPPGQPPQTGQAPQSGMGAAKMGQAKKAMSVAMCFAKAMKKMFPKLKVIIMQMGPSGIQALKQQVVGAMPPR